MIATLAATQSAKNRARPRSARTVGCSLALLLIACGGAQSGSIASERPPGADPEELTREASDAWSALDARRASRLASHAVEAGGGTVAMEIAARASLAIGRNDTAVRALEGASSAHLVRLRAAAQIASRDYASAALTLEGARRDEDPWVDEVAPAVRAAADNGEVYRFGGQASDVALEDLPLPVVRVRIDAIETLALIGSSTQFVVLDPSIRAAAGAIDELSIGEVRLANVPHTVRSLEAVRESLGAEIGAVLGLDVLMALHARIDGPGRRLGLSGAPPSAPDGTSARLLTLTGSFLAVEGELGGAPVWWTVDTAGLFPVALTPGADQALGLADHPWLPASPNGPEVTQVEALRLGALEVERIPVVRGLLDEAFARAVGAPVAGAVGWVLLGQLVTRLDPEARWLVFE